MQKDDADSDSESGTEEKKKSIAVLSTNDSNQVIVILDLASLETVKTKKG
jgi:hypothetical protein